MPREHSSQQWNTRFDQHSLCNSGRNSRRIQTRVAGSTTQKVDENHPYVLVKARSGSKPSNSSKQDGLRHVYNPRAMHQKCASISGAAKASRRVFSPRTPLRVTPMNSRSIKEKKRYLSHGGLSNILSLMKKESKMSHQDTAATLTPRLDPAAQRIIGRFDDLSFTEINRVQRDSFRVVTNYSQKSYSSQRPD